MFVTYDRRDATLPAPPPVGLPCEDDRQTRPHPALLPLLRARQEDALVTGALEPPTLLVVDGDERPRRFEVRLLARGAGDDGPPPAPTLPATLPPDEPPPDGRALLARLLRRPHDDEWFLSPLTTGPVVVDERVVRLPAWLLWRPQEEDVWLPGILPHAALYAQIDLVPSFECNLDFAATFSCTLTLAPGT